MRVPPVPVLLACAAFAFAEDSAPADTAVATSNGVVVHGVDTKLLAARLRDTDRKVVAGDAAGAGADLAEILTGDLSAMIEDGDDAYLGAREAALQRVAALPPAGLSAYRAIVDPRASALLDRATAHADPAPLALHAADMALSSYGPRLLVTLADLRAARGELTAAGQALSDLVRLWPEEGATAEMPGVERAAVVARLATIAAWLGDESSVRWLVRGASPALLGAPSPTTQGAKLADDLARCVQLAAQRAATSEVGASGRLRVAGETLYDLETFGDVDPSRSREIVEHAIPIGTPSGPALLTREPRSSSNRSRVVAFAPPAEGGQALRQLWQWPPDQEVKAGLRRGGRGEFWPARCGDVVLFPWPRAAERRPRASDWFDEPEDDRNTLVALSIRAEGRLVDERGSFEEKRDDADPELLTLSFCGRPLVVGDAVYTTMVRRAENGGATQLHVARFDLVTEGRSQRLLLRWRRHVLDGNAMPPVLLPVDQLSDQMSGRGEPLAVPAAMAERWGRIYVTSNTGAVACLDAAGGDTLWAEAYTRLGPPIRNAVSRTVQRTWKDVPMAVDGPYVWAAPRDAESLLEFRAMPRGARTTLVDVWRFHGGSGTSTLQGQIFPNLLPDELVRIADGIGWLSGRVPGSRIAGLVPPGSPLASLRMREAGPGEPRRSYAFAQIGESAPAGSPAVAGGAILFPSLKAIYRVPLDDFESAPQVLWQPAGAPRGAAVPDRIGNLVPDGDRLWSVTPHRVVLFERRD